VRLSVVRSIAAGGSPGHALEPGSAVLVATGAPLPPGADAVARWEEVHILPRGADLRHAQEVALSLPVARGENVLPSGGQACKGEPLLEQGDLVDLTALDALLTQGIRQVAVWRKPRVGLLPTGSELVPWDGEAGPSQVRCSNQVLLAHQVRQAGGQPVLLPIVGDDRAALRQAIARAVKEERVDLLVTTGGASQGPFDFTVGAVADLGEVLFAEMAVSPGRGTAFGLVRGVPVLCLPGGALSARVLFEVLGRPAILRLGGRRHVLRERLPVRLTEPVQARRGGTRLVPACLRPTEDGWIAQPCRAREFHCPGQWEGLLFLREGTEPVAEVWGPA
ncbi:MAG: molybdopterin molybdotransferase MoeA, partial [Anaerolineae bacterium]|nr:molybdopterin molybdotransferase MoeA [Anaerolineae bacterium]